VELGREARPGPAAAVEQVEQIVADGGRVTGASRRAAAPR
jgi:hypothetical protein